MMDIKKYTALLLLVLLVLSCERLERPIYCNEVGRFVRFNLQVNSDGEVIEEGIVSGSATVETEYNQKSVKTLAIPVTITSEPLMEEIEVYFSYDTVGSFTEFSVFPEGILKYSGSDLTDTIYVDFLSRWDDSVESQLVFKLDSVSDDSIRIGNLNNIEENDELIVNLSELILRYNFPLTNKVEILGEIGEEVLVDVEFPDGFFPDEIAGVELLVPGFEEMAYNVELLPYTDEDLRVTYKIVLEEAIDIDSLTFTLSFNLTELATYELAGYSKFSIVKPEVVMKDISLNTAAQFYDVDDAYYRTYGETWMDYNNDDTCAWTKFNQFTFPVEVDAAHPFAVLGDNMGTSDPNDDVYYHAFRVGFNSPNAGRTTNSFNLKRWFDNGYTDADESPGFNIPEALEFYPDNDGTSATSGVVKVIAQDIILTGKQADGSLVAHTISIAGEGEYFEVSDGLFEIDLAFEATNEELFGGTRTVHYVIFNSDDYVRPVDREDGCFSQMSL